MGINTVIGQDGWGTETKELGGGGSGQDTQVRAIAVGDYDPIQGDISRPLQWFIDNKKQSLASKKYVDEHAQPVYIPWSEYRQIFNGGSYTVKVGEITEPATQVDFRYGLIGSQSASFGNPKTYELHIDFDTDLTSFKTYAPADFPSIDTFYTYANPDTGAVEIWIVMTGGFIRERYLATRTLNGVYSDLTEQKLGDPLPDGAIPFSQDSGSGVVSVNGRAGAVVLNSADVGLSYVINNGSGTLFLSDDGTYKSSSGGALVYSIPATTLNFGDAQTFAFNTNLAIGIYHTTGSAGGQTFTGAFKIYLIPIATGLYMINTSAIQLLSGSDGDVVIKLACYGNTFNNDFLQHYETVDNNQVLVGSLTGTTNECELFTLDMTKIYINQVSGVFSITPNPPPPPENKL